MEAIKHVRVLVLTDTTTAEPALLDAIRARAQQGPVQFRLVVPNPAPAEWHPLHPERHNKATAAEQAFREAQPAIEAAAGGPVIASVSTRHDPMDVVDSVIYHEPVDEIMLALEPHPLEKWFHVDLPHRLAHLRLPITTVKVAGGA